LVDKGDVSDWVAAGGTRAKLLELVELLPADEEPTQNTDWFGALLLSRTGEPLPILANALTGLRNDVGLKNRMTYNEMLCQPMLSCSPPVPIGDQEITEIHEYLQRLALRRISRDNVMWAIYSHARKSPYHPLRDHLNQITWDGQARLETWLAVYLGAENNVYNAHVGTMFLLSMVARVFRPGCKADYMMVLEGPQGKKKSMACAILAGDDYFSDHLPEIGQGKEVSQHLRGKWLIEISEMHAFNRAEATALKAFLSRTIERYRPPFHRIEVDEPRQCVFIGTSNKGQYLRDETGGRRFWPVKCGDLDIDTLVEDRDQLLAEAVHRFKDGEHWWPNADFEREHIQPQQQARFEFDPWFDAIKANLEASSLREISVWEVAQGLGFENRKQLGTMDTRRITACLGALGCECKHTDRGNRWVLPLGLGGSMV
jgi:predicted P-loop ATPase